MINFSEHERPDIEKGFSNPQKNPVDAERSRVGKMWDAVLRGGVAASREGENVADAMADATPHVANGAHHLGRATKDLIVGIFTGKAGK